MDKNRHVGRYAASVGDLCLGLSSDISYLYNFRQIAQTA